MEKKRKLTKAELKERQKASGNAHKGNLINMMDRPEKERLEIQQKGQAAMMEAKRKKKAIKDICNDLLSVNALDIATGVLSDELIEKLENSDINVTLYDLIVAKQAEIALKGSTKAAEFIRDSSGDKPKDASEIDINVTTDSDRALMQNLNDRLEALEAVDVTTS